MPRRLYTRATADPERASNGVPVVGSYENIPPTDRPYKIRAIARTAKTERTIEVALTYDEARKLVDAFVSFGTHGRHGRVETGSA